MTYEPGGSDRRAELVAVIHRVRNRWRLKLALRGLVIVVAGTLLALLLSASSLEALRFSPAAITSFRLVALAVFAGLVFIGFVQPLRRRVSDGQVALYLEEKDPTLQTAILSAIESIPAAGSDRGPSPALVEKLIDQAIEKCHALEDGVAVERTNLRRQLAFLGGVAAVATVLIAFGPAFLRSGLSALLIISRSAEAASPYKIDVAPGSQKVPKGTDLNVKAKLLGFASADATLMLRTDAAGSFERVPLVAATDAGSFEGTLFHLEKSADYYVEANGVRSGTFTLDVVDLPTVDTLAMEYRFPAYTGLEPRTVEPGGDVAAIKGTDVLLKITPTMATPGGRVILNENESLPLTKSADGTFAANFTVKAQGFYKIELEGPAGEKVNASPQYTIDVLSDQGPSVRFNKPGRDTNATPVEEVFAEVRADDDYGVKSVDLFYSVNGGAEKTVHLFGGAKALPEVTASHTLYLEEMGLKPGDFVSYYAKAADNDLVDGTQSTTSDIYFVQIRPFKKDYKPAQSMAGGGGGGGGAQQVNQLSQQQREIVAATFNIVRDKAKMPADKFREQAVFLTLAQAKLRQQVEELSGKMNSRLDSVDPAFKTIAEALPKAAKEMASAEGNLKGMQAKEALSPEQRALKLLQDAEQQYEVQVSQQQGGGGGGGGQQQMSEDLADLFELELDKLANQYEMQQRAEQQGADKQVDELAEKLKELARRQQQEAERQQRMAAAGQQSSGGGGGDAQRQLAKELEEAARRLQQLTREQQRQELADAARQLQDAANAMRQAAANGSKDAGAQAASALDKIRQAQQKLQRNQNGRGERDVQDAARQAQELADEQKQIANDVQGLEGQQGPSRDARTQALQARKDAMDQKLGQLQDSLEKLANDARGSSKDAARKLDEAAGSITDKRLREKVRYTRNTLRSNQPGDYAKAMEADIQSNLEALKNKIGDAQSAFGQANKQDAVGRAADKTRDLVRGMESLDQRMRDKAQQSARNGQQGQQQGQQGQAGQKGQQGQAGQAGQQGQQGQAGQAGQAGQQGQQGSQGQAGQQGQGGARDGNLAGGAYGGQYANGYGANRGQYRFDPSDVRQFRNDMREWQNDAQALRRELNQAGVDTKDLEQILRDLRAFDSDAAFTDGNSLALLQAQALDKLKKFEFALRRKADGGDQPLSLSGSDEVPAGFRSAIEEYYRSLARRQQQ